MRRAGSGLIFGSENIAVLAAVAVVPEPATWAIMLIGFLGVGFAFHRSRRKLSFG
jgi:hypothetical protein